MASETIIIRGAATHNLKHIDLDLPRDKLIVITGLSGSGKSSLAFDTIYAEGQRRYVESLSSYARQFLSIMDKPEIDHIEGLSPAISIQQKTSSHNPRSTVGTVTEIHDYLRLLFARVGIPKCPNHNVFLESQTVSQMIDQILALPEGSKIMLLAPLVRERKGSHIEQINMIKHLGLARIRINGEIVDLEQVPELNKNQKHTIEAVVDRIKTRDDIRQRLSESIETCLNLSEGLVLVSFIDGNEPDMLMSENYSCHECGYSVSKLEPKMFSFNSPAGACQTCDGLGIQQYFDENKVIAHPELSLADGVFKSWNKNNSWYYQLLLALANHYKFNLNVPFNRLSADIKNIILYGSAGQTIKYQYVTSNGKKYSQEHVFEGIIPNMQRRYRETESKAVRDELHKYQNSRLCEDCQGSRLRQESRNVFISGRTLSEISNLAIGDCLEFFNNLKLKGWRAEVAQKIIQEIRQRTSFLVNVGLDYLSFSRGADTLSGGESQRIRLASQIGAGLVGVMYVLDEPSIGLHQRDNQRLLSTLLHLRDIGNTVIVVEHDEEAIMHADFVVDIGPGAGIHGGNIVASGAPNKIINNTNSLTGQYLSGKLHIIGSHEIKPFNKSKKIVIKGAKGNNLNNISVEFPIGLLSCVTGVSGSGKSTLVNGTLYPLAANFLNRSSYQAQAYDSVQGLHNLDKVVNIDQSPIGRTPRSNPATYTGLFTPIRELFAATSEARARGYNPGRFSFNVKGGRCEACRGDGVIKVEMHFLSDVYVNCDICSGMRYNRETLEINYKGKNIFEILTMTIEEARQFFDAIPTIAHKLQTLIDVGLSYLTLGQNAVTLSGGEAQRVKISRELSKKDTGNALYILDEPTTGLHFHDINQLLKVLFRLRDHGNTIIVIEHNMDVIKNSDWIIDLGPEGGYGGGQVVAIGSPQTIAQSQGSHTGKYLQF